MFVLLFINGWAQGMGWPPSGRTMVHWWSQKERGSVVSVWNVAHNVGGGLIGPLFLLGLALDQLGDATARAFQHARELRALDDRLDDPAVQPASRSVCRTF